MSGTWRLTLHRRDFTGNTPANSLLVTELTGARSARLEQVWNSSATLSFTLDGRAPATALLAELAHEVIAWRYSDATGEVAVFRGPVCHTEDQLTEQVHTVNVRCLDYAALLGRRLLTQPLTTSQDQDAVVLQLVNAAALSPVSSAGTALTPGGLLPIAARNVNPDGTFRGAASGVNRQRQYPANTNIGDALDKLAKVSGGFDYDAKPLGLTNWQDAFRVFYPRQGVTRTDMALVYGSNVSALTRTITSAAYANYWRVIGASPDGTTDPMADQLFFDVWNTDATSGGAGAVGMWQSGEEQTDVNVQATITETAQGNLAFSGVLMPTYSLSLTPDRYVWGSPNMGDTVPLVVVSGRLSVNTNVRVVGITYDIDDDGQEDVSLTVGQPTIELVDLLARGQRGMAAISHR